MKIYSTGTVQCHVQFQEITEKYTSCFSIKGLHKQWKNVLLLHILQRKSYVRSCTQTVIKKFYLLKNILAYCGYSPTSSFFLSFSENKHCDKAVTNCNSENARSRMVVNLRGAWVRGQRKMSQALGAFGLLDFAMLRPVLAWRAFWTLWTVYFFNFSMFFFGPQ